MTRKVFLVFVCFCFSINAEIPSSIEPAQFTDEIPITEMSAKEITQKLKPYICERLETVLYNRIGVVEQFLKHYESLKAKNVHLSPIDAVSSFKLKDDVQKGGPCVLLTLDCLNHLPQGIRGHVVAATLSKRHQQFAAPAFCHTAVLISYRDPKDHMKRGYVLLDPSFDIAKPIVLEKGASDEFDTGRNGIWTFSLADEGICCKSKAHSGEIWGDGDPRKIQMLYRTDHFVNPIAASALPMILIDRKLALVARDQNGKRIAHIRIELDKERVIWDDFGKVYPPISFKEFLQKEFCIHEAFAAHFKLSSDYLEKTIKYIILRKDILNELYVEYVLALFEEKRKDLMGIPDMGKLSFLPLKQSLLEKEKILLSECH